MRPSARRNQDIAPFHVMELLARAQALEARGRDIVHMEVGEPDFPTPAPIVRAAQAAIAAGKTFYTPALGLPELRQAIADFYRSRYGVDVPARRIVVTAGASGALTLALACLTDPNSRWLLADPGYPCNRHFVRVFEGEPVAVPVGPEDNFQLTPALLARYWDDRTAGALVASPANPTGTLLSSVELETLAEATRARNGHLLVDEIYHGLSYDQDCPTALAAGDDLWVINSFSKYFQMTGWRLGWLVVPETYLREVEKLAQNLFIAPSTPAQHAALAAFQPETLSILEARRAILRQRRDYLAPALAQLGFRLAARPEGAFYLWCDCSALADDSFTLATRLLEEAGVAATPGLDFGHHQPERYIRFAYTTDQARLEEAVARLGRYLGR
ncbi:pyridoxal phosphate-dependent aminotransferase [Azovibrio restrictus]|uniref:pyridoxal phosphate-dependent aminotransferase n=1 Tax=Azovibrio restrictus TaxID=146938 RepID=UPI0026ED0DD5|nr:pyridoxal phosphate-dependent aminotransferase [Azovibrio restrictus]